MSYRILLLGPALDAVSGVSTHLNQLINSSLNEMWDLEHFQVGSEGRNERAWQKITRIGLSPISFAWRVICHHPTIVHLNTSLNLKSFWRDSVYLLIAKMLGLRVVWQVHGGALPQAFFKNSVLLTRLLKGLLKFPDVIVVLASNELQAYKEFLPEQQPILIPNAVTLATISVTQWPKRRVDANLRLLYLGRLSKEKGVDTVLEAVAYLHSKGRNVRLTIAGTGPLEPFLHDKVKSLSLEEVVNFIGVVSGTAKQEVFYSADVFVFPTHHEGLPYALLESMAAGTPVLTTPVGAIPDVIEQGIHGLFVPPKDVMALVARLEELMNDKALLMNMGQACRQRVQAVYTLERQVERFHEVYSLLARKGSNSIR